MIIETYGYARAGFLGNPSDGYFGKTISFSVRNFRARVLLYPSARLEIKLSKADLPVFENLQDLYETTRWRGYYGGIRIIQALIVRFLDYCRQKGIELEDRNFTIEYDLACLPGPCGGAIHKDSAAQQHQAATVGLNRGPVLATRMSADSQVGFQKPRR